MRHIKFFIPFFIVTIFFACRRDFSSEKNNNNQLPAENKLARYTKSGVPTILGKEIPNYYSIDNISKGIAKLKGVPFQSSSNSINRTSINVGGLQVDANFKYIRFLPTDEYQLMELIDAGLDLYEEPLHFEVDQLGETYHDPSLPDSVITWMYAVVPIDYQLPSTIRTEVLSEVFLFNTELEEQEEDEFEDSDPEPGNPYYCNTPPDITTRIMPCKYSRRSQLMNDAYQWLVNNGINPDSLEDEAMNTAGYIEQADARKCAKRRPWGRITVADNNLGVNVPVKGLMVKARNFLKIKRTYTDVNGNFSISKKYRKATIVVKWRNRLATTRGIDNWWKFYDIFFPIKYRIGQFECGALENIIFNFPFTTDHRSLWNERYAASHFLNSLWETYENTRLDGISNPPNKLRVYLVSRWFNGSAFTPMFSQVYGRGFPIDEFINLLQLKLGRAITGALKKLLLKNAPDIFEPTFRDIAGVRQSAGADEMTNTSYHELGHAIHYSQVGADYWKRNTYVAYGYNLVTYGGDYGPKNGQFAPFVGVTEMWGFYFGNTLTFRKYNQIFLNTGNATARFISETNRNQLENNIPDDNTNVTMGNDRSWSWIPFGYIHDMTDNGENVGITGVNDGVNTYTLNGAFRGMQLNVTDVCGYMEEALRRNSFSQDLQMRLMMDSYRWQCWAP